MIPSLVELEHLHAHLPLGRGDDLDLGGRDHRQGQRARSADRRAVDEGVQIGQIDRVPGGQSGGDLGGPGRLDADDPYAGVAFPQPGGAAGDQPTAAHRDDENVGHAAELLEDLDGHGALAGDGVGSSKAGTTVAPVRSASARAAALASS